MAIPMSEKPCVVCARWATRACTECRDASAFRESVKCVECLDTGRITQHVEHRGVHTVDCPYCERGKR